MNSKKIINVVAGFICKDKKFLICQRPAGKARALLWEFAGGKVEQGESHAAALKREFMEELAVEIEVSDLFYSHSHEYDDVIVNRSAPKKLTTTVFALLMKKFWKF